MRNNFDQKAFSSDLTVTRIEDVKNKKRSISLEQSIPNTTGFLSDQSKKKKKVFQIDNYLTFNHNLLNKIGSYVKKTRKYDCSNKLKLIIKFSIITNRNRRTAYFYRKILELLWCKLCINFNIRVDVIHLKESAYKNKSVRRLLFVLKDPKHQVEANEKRLNPTTSNCYEVIHQMKKFEWPFGVNVYVYYYVSFLSSNLLSSLPNTFTLTNTHSHTIFNHIPLVHGKSDLETSNDSFNTDSFDTYTLTHHKGVDLYG